MPFYCALVIANGLSGGLIRANDNDSTDVKAADVGSIEGLVVYRPDSKRPWRYSRYYIKDPKSGALAEAVVAIRGTGLNRAESASPATTKIDQRNFQFQPETVAIRQGDSVTFTNSDQATHNVRSSGELATFNASIPAGDHDGYTVRFDRAGDIRQPVEIGCVFHSNMRAWVFVFGHPFYKVTHSDGRFRFVDVPQGAYELEMAHPAGALRWRKRIDVKSGETLRIDIHVSSDDIK